MSWDGDRKTASTGSYFVDAVSPRSPTASLFIFFESGRGNVNVPSDRTTDGGGSHFARDDRKLDRIEQKGIAGEQEVAHENRSPLVATPRSRAFPEWRWCRLSPMLGLSPFFRRPSSLPAPTPFLSDNEWRKTDRAMNVNTPDSHIRLAVGLVTSSYFLFHFILLNDRVLKYRFQRKKKSVAMSGKKIWRCFVFFLVFFRQNREARWKRDSTPTKK